MIYFCVFVSALKEVIFIMKHNLLYRFRLLHHYYHARSKFDIHSPFVYKFYSEILKDKTDYAAYHTPIEKVSIRNASLSNKDYRLLFRLSRYFTPKTILILGTLDEKCGSYLASGSPGSRLISVHNGPDWKIDSGMFDMVIVSGCLPGNILADYFSGSMQHIHNDSVQIFCNINGSKAIHDMWIEIKNHASVTLTIDLFNLGLVFFKEELTKEDYILRY